MNGNFFEQLDESQKLKYETYVYFDVIKRFIVNYDRNILIEKIVFYLENTDLDFPNEFHDTAYLSLADYIGSVIDTILPIICIIEMAAMAVEEVKCNNYLSQYELDNFKAQKFN
jgi:hypothetical protein